MKKLLAALAALMLAPVASAQQPAPKVDQDKLDIASNQLDFLMRDYKAAQIGNTAVSSLQQGYQVSGNVETKPAQPLSFRIMCGLDCSNIGLSIKDTTTGKVLGQEKDRDEALVVLQPGHPAKLTFVIEMLKCGAPACAYAAGYYSTVAVREEHATATLFGIAPDKPPGKSDDKAGAAQTAAGPAQPKQDFSKYINENNTLTPKLAEDVNRMLLEANRKSAADLFESDPVTVYLDNNASYGWRRAGNVDIQDVKDLKVHTYRFHVDPKKPVTVYGVCEHGCKDMKVEAVEASSGKSLDTFSGSEPVLNIPAGASDIAVKARAAACTADACRFGVGAYQK
jgi:hypothetical protein